MINQNFLIYYKNQSHEWVNLTMSHVKISSSRFKSEIQNFEPIINGRNGSQYIELTSHNTILEKEDQMANKTRDDACLCWQTMEHKLKRQ